MMAGSHWRWKQCDQIPSPRVSNLALQGLEIAVNRGLIHYPFLHDYDPFLAKFRGLTQPVLSKPGTLNCSPFLSEDWCATMPGTVMARAS